MGKKASLSVSPLPIPKTSAQQNFTDSPEKETEAEIIAQGIHAIDIDKSTDLLAGDEDSVASDTFLQPLQSPSVVSDNGMHVSVYVCMCTSQFIEITKGLVIAN